MQYHGTRHMDDSGLQIDKIEKQVAVFAPSETKAFVKAAHTFKCQFSTEAIRRDKFRVGQMRCVFFIVGGRRWNRHDELAPRRIGALLKCVQAALQPSVARAAIVIGKGDKTRCCVTPA